ncbi:MAG: glycerol-3-phosphate 1-O-acyltransferase PlsY [Gemmatimonadota bacterium]|nr:glycerol-3-phosphate 1-O-acyltransferase PlsY [Gemmatimonadota bacterium]MDH3421975.1 glycerol-3-phosphate 1-O-acyltransferase PlsY [Gemmatimonadota bacterium]
MTYALLVLAYLIGAVPTSYVIGKVFHGIDLREHGSGNLGATNAFRILGVKSAIPVVILDMAKGFVPAWFFAGIASVGFGWTLGFGAAAIVGHMFSVFVGFKGGKGMATSAGVFLGFAPWAVLGGLVLWCALTFSTGYVSVGSIGAAVATPFLVALTPHRGGGGLLWFAIGLAVVVVWAHRANIGRLLRGEENRFGRRGRAAQAASGPGGES